MAQTRAQTRQTNPSADTNGTATSNGSTKSSKKTDLINGIAPTTYQRNIHFGALAAAIFMGLTSWLVWTGKVNLAGKVDDQKLSGYGLKAEFVFRYLILGVAWLIFNVHAVIFKRLGSPALDPLNGYEHLTQANRNILTNSVEQLLITAIAQLSVISYCNGYIVVRAIPLMNLFYLVGRIAFFVGYPRYRSFGHFTTATPPVVAASFALYKFGIHLGLY